jgi:hypothetical protein
MTAPTVTGATICAGCDQPVPPPSPRGGRPRKWCSDECRRRAWDRENVVLFCACGMRIDPPSVRQGTTQCRRCFLAAEERRVRERAERFAAMWADGRSLNEIADEFGWTRGHLSMEFNRIRQRWPGLLPYRYARYAGKAWADGES